MTKLSPIQQLWLNTLVSARELLRVPNLRPHWANVELTTVSGAFRLLETHWENAAFQEVDSGKLQCYVPEQLTSLPRIEQQEAMLYILGEAHRVLCIKGLTDWKFDVPREMFDTLQCWYMNTVQINHRWRYLNKARDINTLWYANMEDRVVCKICSGRIATGDSYDPLLDLEADWKNEDLLPPARPDVHHECMRYARLILVPGINEARRQMAAERSKEIDK